MKDLRAAYGQYAVVTGASSGIGEEFARQLAAAGVNVVLVARRKGRLDALAAELSRIHGTTNEVVALDLLADGAVDELWRRVGDVDVGLVVANAGISLAGPLVAHSLADELDVFALDGAVPLQLAHRFGRDFAQRRRGAIVLVSSSIAASPVPYSANYAAVKAYVLSLGQALNYELKKDGVDVLVATTVVEVGIDIPNATVMVVLGAERFGLAQLHQLRGRIGRGSERSYCVLVSDASDSERLAAMTAKKRDENGREVPLDGFDLAKRDLAIRGAGEFLGVRQSGVPELRIVDLADVDPELISETAEEADRILAGDAALSRSEHAELSRAVDQLWRRYALA